MRGYAGGDPDTVTAYAGKRIQRGAVYAVGHFLVDFACALTMLVGEGTLGGFLTYNFCAFALQMPIGLLADLRNRNRVFALCGIFLVLLGLLPLPLFSRVLLLGVGNACYHVGGGRDALLSGRKMTGLGIFVSPGALGIFLGARLAGSVWAAWLAAGGLLLCGVFLILLCREITRTEAVRKSHPSLAAWMLLVVILRSLVGLCMDTPWKTGVFAVLAAVACAAGKALGGAAGDRWGGKKAGEVSLILAAFLFCFPRWGVAGCLGVLAFNVTMPITLRYAADALPGREGFAFGLLTFGLFLGYLPAQFGVTLSAGWTAGLSVLSAGILVACYADKNSAVLA